MRKKLSFSAIGAIGSKIIQLLVFITLARLLSPEEFGLMAILNVLNAFTLIFVEMGLGAALIHNQNASYKHYTSASFMSVLLGIILSCLVYFSASEIASFYEKKELEVLIKVFSIIFVINAFAVVPMSILQKAGDFKSISLVELTSLIIASVIGVYMASIGYGVWSLLAVSMVNALGRGILFSFFSKGLISLRFGLDELKELWGYTKYIIGTRVLNFGVSNLDTIIIAKIASNSELGLYNTAYRLMSLPVDIVSSIFNRVLISKYAKHQHEHHVIKEFHLKVVRLVAMMTFPFNIGMLVLADVFVVVVFGEKWVAMESVLQFFAVIMLFHPIGVMNGSIYLSQGKTRLHFYVGLFVKVVTIVSIVIGSFWGVYGILYALLVAMCINFYPAMYYCGSVVGIKVSEILASLRNIFISAVLAGILTVIMKYVFLDEKSVINLVLLSVVFLLTYGCLVYSMNKSFIKSCIFLKKSKFMKEYV